jgi:hypothetical protein
MDATQLDLTQLFGSVKYAQWEAREILLKLKVARKGQGSSDDLWGIMGEFQIRASEWLLCNGDRWAACENKYGELVAVAIIPADLEDSPKVYFSPPNDRGCGSTLFSGENALLILRGEFGRISGEAND